MIDMNPMTKGNYFLSGMELNNNKSSEDFRQENITD